MPVMASSCATALQRGDDRQECQPDVFISAPIIIILMFFMDVQVAKAVHRTKRQMKRPMKNINVHLGGVWAKSSGWNEP